MEDLDLSNFDAAHKALEMTPQEQQLYMTHLNNLWGPGGVTNPDGSRSTLYQGSVEGPGGKIYNIPTVWNGKILNFRDAIDQVRRVGWDNFPSYNSEKEAEDRYNLMHSYMEKDTDQYFKNKQTVADYLARARARYGGQ